MGLLGKRMTLKDGRTGICRQVVCGCVTKLKLFEDNGEISKFCAIDVESVEDIVDVADEKVEDLVIDLEAALEIGRDLDTCANGICTDCSMYKRRCDKDTEIHNCSDSVMVNASNMIQTLVKALRMEEACNE